MTKDAQLKNKDDTLFGFSMNFSLARIESKTSSVLLLDELLACRWLMPCVLRCLWTYLDLAALLVV